VAAPVQSGAEKLSFEPAIVPLRDEANVIAETLRGLLRQTHPRMHIVVSLCDDDESTISAVRSVVSDNLLTNRITIVHRPLREPPPRHSSSTGRSRCAWGTWSA
jgi:cellulose synthase/poly-beta-1,6-N-acetylglucosamine synthase-like glycosyltransferase